MFSYYWIFFFRNGKIGLIIYLFDDKLDNKNNGLLILAGPSDYKLPFTKTSSHLTVLSHNGWNFEYFVYKV